MGKVNLIVNKKKSYHNKDNDYKTESLIHFKLNKIIKLLEDLLHLGR